MIDAVLDGADAAIPAVAVTDTIKVLDRTVDPTADVWGSVIDTPDRGRLVAVQTRRRSAPSDCELRTVRARTRPTMRRWSEAVGGTVVVVRGDTINRKITEPDDLDWARRQFATEVDR